MRAAWLALLAAHAAPAWADTATSSVAYVAGVVRGAAVVSTDRGSAPLAAGAALPHDAVLEVAGWCELWGADDARLRLGEGARVRLLGARVVVERGRVWIQRPARAARRPLEAAVGRWRVAVPAGASVVIEESATAGETVGVRAGRAEVRVAGAAVPAVVGPGDVARGAPLAVRPGGAALLDLASGEARAALRDPWGLHAALASRARRAPLGPLDVRAVMDVLRADAELAGADGGAPGFLLEEALRPPAFFEREVPDKGPNLEIAVEFAE